MRWIAFLAAPVWVLAQSAATPQVDRGQALFLDAATGCASCHALKGKGTAIGPDLTGIGHLSAAAIGMAARSTVTQYVEKVELTTKQSFPGFPVKKDEKSATYYDMSKTPPELRTLEKSQITATRGNDLWTHPPAAAKISAENLADIVAYIRYCATGNKSTVDPADVK
jgi:mono/diheme cytochrome c family protein